MPISTPPASAMPPRRPSSAPRVAVPAVSAKMPCTASMPWAMIQRRAAAIGLRVKIGCHTFRATGITAYLSGGGTLEKAQTMAAHESPRTTKLYDRTSDEITLDEVERIAI